MWPPLAPFTRLPTTKTTNRTKDYGGSTFVVSVVNLGRP
jgi:hypothetical protein